MFLVDAARFSEPNRFYDVPKEALEQRLVARLRRLGYINNKVKPRTADIEKTIIAIAHSKPEMIKVIGEPLVYRFMDRRKGE